MSNPCSKMIRIVNPDGQDRLESLDDLLAGEWTEVSRETTIITVPAETDIERIDRITFEHNGIHHTFVLNWNHGNE